MNKILIPTEIYSRVSGYFRPVIQWNNGKKEEFIERKKLNYNKKPLIDSLSNIKNN